MGSNISSSKDKIVKMESFCKQHGKKLTLFCKQHDSPCCSTCTSQNHKQCQEHISDINDIVQNVKTSYAFLETEQILNELAENIQTIQKDREENLVSLANSKIQIEKEITEFRTKLNDHLDKLQEDIIKELNNAEETERDNIQKMVDDLKHREKEVNEMQANLSSVKQHATDVHAYVTMKQIKNDVNQLEADIDSLVKTDNLHQKLLSLEINAAAKDILTCVKNLGKIVVGSKDSNVAITKMKNQQVQLLVPHRPYRGIDDINLQLQQTMVVNSTMIIGGRSLVVNSCSTKGCCSLPDGRLVFSSYESELFLMNADGTENTTLTVPSEPCDVIYVTYNNTLAVTYGYNGDRDSVGLHQCITFINITSKVQETIEFDSFCYGIAVKDHILFYCTKDSIQSVNLKDKSITKFKVFNEEINSFSYIDIFENHLYHTNPYTDTVTCYDLSGEVKWEFKNTSIIHNIRGISVDNRGNVYVAGYATFNVVVISPDGQRCRELLSTKDEVFEPHAIHYDRSTDNLLVANFQDQNAFLYKVT